MLLSHIFRAKKILGHGFLLLSISACGGGGDGGSDTGTGDGGGGDSEVSDSFPATNTSINLTGNGGPDLDVKRGRSAALDKISKFRKSADLGFTLAHAHQNMVGYDTNYEEPLDQFYYGPGGGINVRVDDDVVSDRQAIVAEGLTLIHQATGTPYYGHGPHDNFGDIQMWPMAVNYEWPGGGNWYPLPNNKTLREDYGTTLGDWINMVENADGSGTNSIWIGNQEPAHTIGDPTGAGTGLTTQEKKDNISLYIEAWVKTANVVKNAGHQVGGVQLNGSNADYMDHTISELKAANVPFDYFTVQQYKAEKTNTGILNSIRSALQNNNYNTSKKVLFNRYAYKTLDKSLVSDIIETLKAERAVLDNADMVWGICYEGDVFNQTIWATPFEIINAMPANRRPITLAPANVDGFASSSNNAFTAILWNTGSSSTSIELKLENAPDALDNKTLTVKSASGTSIGDVSATWNSSTDEITDFSIPSQGFVTIELK